MNASMNEEKITYDFLLISPTVSGARIVSYFLGECINHCET